MVTSIKRIEVEDRITSLWSLYVGTQGDHKGVKSYERSLRAEFRDDSTELANLLESTKVKKDNKRG